MTKITFSLNDWILYWVDEFSAMAETSYGGVNLPENVVSKWSSEIEALEANANRFADLVVSKQRKTNPHQDMLDYLVGPRLLKNASPDFWEMSSRTQAEIPLPMWEQMSLCDKGKEIAFRQVQNSIEGLTRYQTKLEQNQKEVIAQRERDKQKRRKKK